MIEVTKEFNFAMSHLLHEHKGLCSNLHGHNYKLYVTVKRKQLIGEGSSEGMVIDFKDLKNIVNKNIVDKFDHAFVYNKNSDTEEKISSFLKELLNQKTLPLPFRTTAEKMAIFILNEINIHFILNEIDVKCVKVKLYETDSSYAVARLQ